MPAGIEVRHARACRSREGGGCGCTPAYQAHVFDKRTGKRIRKTFGTRSAAKLWRQDALVALRRGELAPSSTTTTVEGAVTAWIEAAKRGTVRTRGRRPFALGTIRSVEQNYRLRVKDRFGRRRLDRVTLLDLQEWVDELDGDGVHASTIETSVLPLRLAYRRAKGRGEIPVDPTDGLELPSKPIRGSARRPPEPNRLRALLDAAPACDRPAWATLILTGLRRGELRGLEWRQLDFNAGVIRVEQQYQEGEGLKPTKGRRNRTVPLGETLATTLREHRLRTGRREGLVFGEDGRRPLDTGKLQTRADEAWEEAELSRVTPHVCRHYYATMMAAAGTPLERLSRYLGHSSIAVTWDNYGHLFPGDEVADATLQEAFLAAISPARTNLITGSERA
jgi:integrase